MQYGAMPVVTVLLVQALLVAGWTAEASAQTCPSSPLTRLLEAELERFLGTAGLYVKHLASHRGILWRSFLDWS